jgi:Flp pilus assembly protein TadG
MIRIKFWRSLARDSQGAALPMMAAGMLVVLAGIGSAIDLGRIAMVKYQMQSGVDAGALAGARVFGLTNDRDQQVDAYFLSNMPTGYMGSLPIEPGADFQEVRGVNRVEVTAATQLPMMFMKLFGIPTASISVVAVAEMQPKPLEVMVVLDDTGSMASSLNGGTRMSALKTAMYDFIDILHQGKSRREDLALGFVTYTVTTNVGAILRDAGVAIQNRDGFTNVGDYTGTSSAIGENPLGWRGCVENDQTVRDLSSSATTFETGAYDIDKVLPGEEGRPGARPYHYPPVTTTNAVKASGESSTLSGAWATSARRPEHYQAKDKNNNTSSGRRNNLYRLSPGGDLTIAQNLANSPAYRQYFYDFYIGLNYNTAYSGDDVIVRASDGGYYTPGSADAWKVDYSRIPYIGATTDWANPNTRYGYPTRSGLNLSMPTPNWQCPEPSMALQYGRAKTDYDDYITYDNYPLMPASGTLHHIGMLWGYRLLTRSDVFTRTNPVPDEKPLRALVFMTDGDTQANPDDAWYGAYGGLREKRISSDGSNSEKFKDQVMRRFAKVCENAKRDEITVYIVSLLPAPGNTQTIFRNCAGSNYLETGTRTEIQNAFRQIAVDLVDLHLTQ